MTERTRPDPRRGDSPRQGDSVVGDRIKHRREDLGMDRNALAEAAGLSYPYIWQLEKGYRNASYRKQVDIADALGVGLDDLFAPEKLRGSSPGSTPAPSLSSASIDAGGASLAATPSLSSPTRPTLSEVVAAAVNAIESLPSRVRVDALNQIQLRVMRPLMSSSHIESLRPNEVFVFGSNALGLHDGGAARQALEKFGAVWGEGHGHHGQSYAIDTMSGFRALAAEVETFLDYARQHPELRFLVTPIGTGVAGYRVDQIAPLFADKRENVVLPSEFRALLDEES
jgi:transcriptional regulator with XRE-family HTH domain